MEAIAPAIEPAEAGTPGDGDISSTSASNGGSRKNQIVPYIRRIELASRVLEKNRIVTHGDSLASRTFDVLRTQIVQEMYEKGWRCLGITSPGIGCGKSTVACNLAISIGRLMDRAPVLIDLDFRKPSVSRYLGLRSETGILDVLNGDASHMDALVHATIGRSSVMVLPVKEKVPHSSDWIAIDAMTELVDAIKRDFPSRLILFDLPPVLAGDDVISMLPRLDALLLVTACGASKLEELGECSRLLDRKPVIRVVVNRFR